MQKRIALLMALAVALLFNHDSAFSQSKETTSKKDKQIIDKKEYSKFPHWISMMRNDDANYFEVLLAYDEFWKNREMPVLEEEELMEQGINAVEEHRKKLNKRELRERQELQQYTYDIKYFEHWKRSVAPYVQEDGRILSADEKLQIWYNQKNQ